MQNLYVCAVDGPDDIGKICDTVELNFVFRQLFSIGPIDELVKMFVKGTTNIKHRSVNRRLANMQSSPDIHLKSSGSVVSNSRCKLLLT